MARWVIPRYLPKCILREVEFKPAPMSDVSIVSSGLIRYVLLLVPNVFSFESSSHQNSSSIIWKIIQLYSKDVGKL